MGNGEFSPKPGHLTGAIESLRVVMRATRFLDGADAVPDDAIVKQIADQHGLTPHETNGVNIVATNIVDREELEAL